MFRFLLPCFFTFFGLCAAVEVPSSTTRAATTKSDAQKSAETPLQVNENNLFVLAVMYFPEIPKDLPKDTKPSQYLKGLTLDKVKFISTDSTLIFSVDPSLKVDGKDAAAYFTPGQKFALPFNVSYYDSEKKVSHDSKGAFLMEVKTAYKDFKDLKDHYDKPIQQDNIWELDSKGVFKEPNQSNAPTPDIKFTPGTIADGWSDQSRADALTVTIYFYEMMGCFVATAIYESWLAPELTLFRAFRDKILKTSESGAHLVDLYYQLGPYWAQEVKGDPSLKSSLKPAFDAFVILLEHVDLDNSLVRGVFHTFVYGIDWLFGSSLEAQKEALYQQGSPLLLEITR